MQYKPFTKALPEGFVWVNKYDDSTTLGKIATVYDDIFNEAGELLASYSEIYSDLRRWDGFLGLPDDVFYINLDEGNEPFYFFKLRKKNNDTQSILNLLEEMKLFCNVMQDGNNKFILELDVVASEPEDDNFEYEFEYYFIGGETSLQEKGQTFIQRFLRAIMPAHVYTDCVLKPTE